MSNFQISSLLHSGYQNNTTRHWQTSGEISKKDLIFPVFIHDNKGKEEIKTLPGQYRYGLDTIEHEFTPLVEKGLECILIFGVPTNLKKDNIGSSADSVDSIVIKSIIAFKKLFPKLLIACDLCLCAYTDHGHCGVMSEGKLDNQKSINRLAQISISYVKAGCELIAPSDMMDGRIRAIKEALLKEGYSHVPVMSYSAKFSSVFYGPFRDAAGSAPSYGDRKCYQLPPGARGLARRALVRDAEEGADMLMIKPGYPYLDIVRDARELVPDLPLAIYQVSGEYAMIWHAAQNNVFDLEQGVMESLESAKRAGANIFITYFTPMLLQWLK